MKSLKDAIYKMLSALNITYKNAFTIEHKIPITIFLTVTLGCVFHLRGFYFHLCALCKCARL